MKTALRRDIRAKLRPLSRQLSQASQDDPVQAVLVDYCEALRDDLRAEGLAPFELAGLHLYEGLQRLATSLRRCEKKGGIPSCPACWASRLSASAMPPRMLN